MNGKIEFINKEKKYIKKIEILELKNTINQVLNSLYGLSRRIETVEEGISELGDRSIESI